MLRLTFLLPIAFLLAAAGEAPRPVRVQTVSWVQSRSGLTISGTVQARTQADLAFRVARQGRRSAGRGRRSRARRPGSGAARPGRPAASAKRRREAALQGAEADAANARADLERYDALGRSSPAYLPSEYDKRTAATRMADARAGAGCYGSSHWPTTSAATARSRRTPTAIVTALPVQVGQVVAAGQTVATLAHTAETEVVVDVPENRLADVRSARDVAISLWAVPGHGAARARAGDRRAGRRRPAGPSR